MDGRKRAVIRENLRRQSCLQMRDMVRAEAVIQGKDDLKLRIPDDEIMSPEEVLSFMANNRPLRNDHQGAFIKLFIDHCPSINLSGTLLDIGCGTGELPVFMALVFPQLSITAVDASALAITEAEKLASAMNMANPPTFIRAHVPHDRLPDTKFDTVFSRSTLHHFAEGADFWRTVKNHARPRGAVFVFDLARPLTRRIAELQVDSNISTRAVSKHHRDNYIQSYMAAYRPDEVRADLALAGLKDVSVKATGISHLIAWRDARKG